MSEKALGFRSSSRPAPNIDLNPIDRKGKDKKFCCEMGKNGFREFLFDFIAREKKAGRYYRKVNSISKYIFDLDRNVLFRLLLYIFSIAILRLLIGKILRGCNTTLAGE